VLKWVVVATALCLLAVSGCGSGTSVDEADAETGVAGAVAEFRRMAEDPSLYEVRWADFNLFVAECMRGQGFDFTPTTAPVGYTGSGRFPGYELVSMPLDEARDSGFSFQLIAPDPDLVVAGPFDAPDLDGLPEVFSSDELAWTVAMVGWGGDHDIAEDAGCYAAATREVGPLSFEESSLSFDQQAELERYLAMVSDERAVGLASNWATCMAERGHASVNDPFNTLATASYFWAQMVPQWVGSAIDEYEYWDLAVEQRNQIDEAHLALASDYVQCAMPLRAGFADLWAEFLGFVP
jgi:hypothetical protein